VRHVLAHRKPGRSVHRAQNTLILSGRLTTDANQRGVVSTRFFDTL